MSYQTNTKAPCLNCEDRHTACHSHCEKYLKVKAMNDELNEQRKKIKAAESDVYNYNKAGRIAANKKKGIAK